MSQENKQTIIIADDDPSIRFILSQALEREGFNTVTADDIPTLMALIERGDGNLLICDVLMPSGNSLDHLLLLKKPRQTLPVIVISAHNTMKTALKAEESGAYEYFPKPFDLPDIIAASKRVLGEKTGQIDMTWDTSEGPLIGRSQAMQHLYRSMSKLIQSDLTVLLYGESGTGKELVARTIHERGMRASNPFVAVNMAAIPTELIESELFGHEKGAFTGATHKRSGFFEEANEGTLFLDEIGDMPLGVQTRLLRVLQEGEYRRVGGGSNQKSNVRIIAASHKDLEALVEQNLFRRDLYYRLNVVPLFVPPLREREGDIARLAAYFLDRESHRAGQVKKLTPAAVDAFGAHNWPGNVRELENFIKRVFVLSPDQIIDEKMIQANFPVARNSMAGALQNRPTSSMSNGTIVDVLKTLLDEYFGQHSDECPPAGLYARILRDVERPLITKTLEATKGNQIKAAEVLGLNRNTLRKKIRELSINIKDFR